jgi:hypothetical protein
VVDGFLALQKAGYAGVAFYTLNYLDDLPIFIDQVLPMMKEAGLRV